LEEQIYVSEVNAYERIRKLLIPPRSLLCYRGGGNDGKRGAWIKEVFMADESQAIWDRLRDLISELDRVEVIGEAENGAQAIEPMVRPRPDVVILYIRIPEGNHTATQNCATLSCNSS
jgi:hypothetical protein